MSDFLNTLGWILITLSIAHLLIFGFEKLTKLKVPNIAKGVIMIPISLSIAISCANIFPLTNLLT